VGQPEIEDTEIDAREMVVVTEVAVTLDLSVAAFRGVRLVAESIRFSL
jgi:hypothetical protein